ncbi:MAG: D-alanine--D-alanine ligase [Candidatus Omnitrophota bacterium]
MVRNFGRIGVLMGGPSAEREVSLCSGKAVLDALLSKGYDVKPIELYMPTKEELKSLDIDVVFIALHGSFGEDGELQSMLEESNIPYTGSRVEASRLAMDKIASRKIFQKARLFIPNYEVLQNGLSPNLKFKMPVVVKPSAQGSSVGLTIVDRKEELKSAMDQAFEFGEEIIIEEYIEGKEIAVGILEDRALPVIQIVPKRRFYDYVAKYTSGMTEYLVPAPISKAEFESAQKAGLRAHKSLGCRSFSRVDMILNKQSAPIVLEVNTIPGLTQISLLPKAAKAAGIDFPELCEKMLESAFLR